MNSERNGVQSFFLLLQFSLSPIIFFLLDFLYLEGEKKSREKKHESLHIKTVVYRNLCVQC